MTFCVPANGLCGGGRSVSIDDGSVNHIVVNMEKQKKNE